MKSFWDRVRQLEGATLVTLHNAKPFAVVEVDGNCVRLRTDGGKGSARSVRREQIEHIASLRLSREELRQRTQVEYPKNQNTSYIAAIVFAANKLASD
jgi:hypothetical protein